jgi:hypothetical protein
VGSLVFLKSWSGQVPREHRRMEKRGTRGGGALSLLDDEVLASACRDVNRSLSAPLVSPRIGDMIHRNSRSDGFSESSLCRDLRPRSAPLFLPHISSWQSVRAAPAGLWARLASTCSCGFQETGRKWFGVCRASEGSSAPHVCCQYRPPDGIANIAPPDRPYPTALRRRKG